MSDTIKAAKNTDRELWRGPDEGCGDYYADAVHITEVGGIGIKAGGTIVVKTPCQWIEQEKELSALRLAATQAREALELPEVWSSEEYDGIVGAYDEKNKHHGHLESLLAACAWLLRYRLAALQPQPKEKD